jgi:hypothetical protein
LLYFVQFRAGCLTSASPVTRRLSVSLCVFVRHFRMYRNAFVVTGGWLMQL